MLVRTCAAKCGCSCHRPGAGKHPCCYTTDPFPKSRAPRATPSRGVFSPPRNCRIVLRAGDITRYVKSNEGHLETTRHKDLADKFTQAEAEKILAHYPSSKVDVEIEMEG